MLALLPSYFVLVLPLNTLSFFMESIYFIYQPLRGLTIGVTQTKMVNGKIIQIFSRNVQLKDYHIQIS